MAAILVKLGVRREVISFFQPFFEVDEHGDLLFSYRDSREHYGFSFHFVPAAAGLWLAGNLQPGQVSHVFICPSAMEAIACLSQNAHRYRHFDNLLFIAVGRSISPRQVHELKTHISAVRHISLVFGHDLLGKVYAIKIAAALRRKRVRITWSPPGTIGVFYRGGLYVFSMHTLSLSAFEKVSGLRSKMKTCVPKKAISYLSILLSAKT